MNEAGLRRASKLLEGAEIEVKDFRDLRSKRLEADDFVYFDPPYHPRSSTSYFTSYTRASFGEKDQKDLAKLFQALDKKNCYLMLSNSDTELIQGLYEHFLVTKVSARRNINSRADRRGPIKEMVILNDRFVRGGHVGG